MRRGRPIKYPRPPNCPHVDRKEHANGVCYQCSSNINNQRKREKKLDDGTSGEPTTPRKRPRKPNSDLYMPSHPAGMGGIVELNVGGKVFATSFATLTREISLLSVLVSGGAGTENFVKYDNRGRIFIDRDPTHFRWLLNYLRDGYLVTIPSQLQHRLEILHEARFYRLDSLASIIASPHQYQQPHPYVTQQMAAQAMAANAAQMQAQAQLQAQPSQDKPSFLTVRPSTRGLFYLCDAKWASLFPERPDLNIIAVNFEDASDEVVFWSINVQLLQDPQMGHIIPSLAGKQELIRTRMDVSMSARTVLEFNENLVCEAEFWWEPSQSQYPQLYGKFWRNEVLQGPLDFLRTEAEQ